VSARIGRPRGTVRRAEDRTGPAAPDAILEHRYRRLLACFPRFFRSDSAEEILAVLMACARPGQRWPAPAECADLVGSAVRMRMGPGRSRPPRAVTTAMRLMRAGAVSEIAGLAVALATASSVQAAITRHHAGFLAAHWHGVLLFIELGVPLPAGLWLWLAWANGRGHQWARSAFAVVFAVYTLLVLGKLAVGAATYAPADLLVVGVQWLIGLAVVVLIFSGSAGDFYRRQTGPPAAAPGG
jgi:hypothetical protein